jgi:hypothetical protein
MKKYLALLILINSILVSNGFAEDSKTILAMEYLEVSKTKEVFDMTIETYVNQLSSNNPNVNKKQLRAFFNSYMGWDVLREPTIKIVADTFTEDELKAINNFYKSKHGVAFANKSPALSAAISELIAANLKKAMSKMQQK